jgi:FtsP/CotA-like multicopper oxidase with cupredoxin domain
MPHISTCKIAALGMLVFGSATLQAETCSRDNTIIADIVALDQAWVWNRYGAIQPHGMMYALEKDIVSLSGGLALSPGKVVLRPGKRPRPLVLRVNKGQCLEVRFRNLLDSSPRDRFQNGLPQYPDSVRCKAGGTDSGCGDPPFERKAGFHVNGLALVQSITDTGQFSGGNASSLIDPGGSITYRYIAEEEGTYFAYSNASTTGGDGNGGSIHNGLFAAVNVEPEGSEWFRSQVTRDALLTASNGTTGNAGQYPKLDYAKLRILDANRVIQHSDLTAIIVPTKKQTAPPGFCLDGDTRIKLELKDVSEVHKKSVCGDPTKPFREFTVIFHDESGAVQAFDEFEACEGNSSTEECKTREITSHALHSVRDGFAINYGTAGAGAEILANRKGVGPVKDCPECMLEEFFLSSWAVGDPAMIVDKPANRKDAKTDPATRVFFPDDPSNVYHSYLNDRLVFRNLHAGPKEHHVFHLHAHQWLQTQHNPRSAYLDSQTIGPGGTYTYEIAYGGSGNRNLSPGDSIFHCHFYPHFAQGMWALWRVHDTFQTGSKLDSLGVPEDAPFNALPDGEIKRGTPTPAIVPLPGQAMAPAPTLTHPGYPFFVPGVPGHRPPSPPLDLVSDGGLPRHVVKGGAATDKMQFDDVVRSMEKKLEKAEVNWLKETGEPLEVGAMEFHEKATHQTVKPDGVVADFHTNGQKRAAGAPFADPCPANSGEPMKFQASVFQYDMVFTKAGWHTPQARILALKDDVEPTKKGDRTPQPLFFRANSGKCINFEHSNITPMYWQQDAFQVKTPTDIIGQHIHLVKFDVLASDGGGNGFNYEDGTMSPDEVRHRIDAICAVPSNGACPTAKPHPWWPGEKEYVGGRVTAQRWWADPQLMLDPADPNRTVDKTLETVFTHDHFGASTHQQAGLYAGLIIEPAESKAYDDIDNSGALTQLHTRTDGGPTSWKAVVYRKDKPAESFREFGLEYQDFHIAFRPGKECPGKLADGQDPVQRDIGCRALNAPGQVPTVNGLGGPAFPSLVKWDFPTWPHRPEAVSADDIGVMSINYRAEPIPVRLQASEGSGQQKAGTGAVADESDLSHVFRSIKRLNGNLNQSQDKYSLVGGVTKASWPVLTKGMQAFDPFTPLLEVYQNERFRVRLLAGAHEHEHSFLLHGLNWHFMPAEPNSGFKSFQATALSEHFEIDGILRDPGGIAKCKEITQSDRLYKIGASVDDLWYGNWGLLRSYCRDKLQTHLPTIENPKFKTGIAIDTGVVDSIRNRNAQILQVAERATAGFVAAPLTDRQRIAGLLREANASLTSTAQKLETQFRNEKGLDAAVKNRGTVERALKTTNTLESYIDETAELAETTQALFERLSVGERPNFRISQQALDPNWPSRLREATTAVANATNGAEFDQLLDRVRLLLPHFFQANEPSQEKVCPANAPLAIYRIVAVRAADVLPGGTLIYHRFSTTPATKVGNEFWENVQDPTALLYARRSDLLNGKWRLTRKIEPLIMRARAGSCVEVELENRLPQDPKISVLERNGYNTLPNLDEKLNFNELTTSRAVGLHPQMLRYDVTSDDGVNVGSNPVQTILPGQTRTYRWYAGNFTEKGFEPIEFGATNLTPSDPIKQGSKGLFGSLTIEPRRSIWLWDITPPEPHSGLGFQISRASARLYFNHGNGWQYARDLTLLGQNDANFRFKGFRRKWLGMKTPIDREVRRVAMASDCGGPASCIEAQLKAESVDSVDTGHKAFNYRSEAMWMRRLGGVAEPLSSTLQRTDSHWLTSNTMVTPNASNQTPLFCAEPGDAVRLRLVFHGGHGRNHVMQVHGHNWLELPWVANSTRLGDNAWSTPKGSQDSIGAGSHWNFLFRHNAGGSNKVTGDYLIRDQYSWGFDNGLWSILRVQPLSTCAY